MRKLLKEGLDHLDFKGQIDPKITIDEYVAKMGSDSDIVTLTFFVNSRLASEDLINWLEVGYDFVLDASLSDGEIEPGKYLVFVELDRRHAVPRRIVEILEDLETLTGLGLSDYKVQIDDQIYDLELEMLEKVMILSPRDYKKVEEKVDDLNEMRNIAGIPTKNTYENDTYIKNIKSMAGL